MSLQSIKNIIFDLGGVIINLDFQLSFEEFSRICNKDVPTVLNVFKDHKVFERHQDGSIDDAEFRNIVREKLNNNLTDDLIDKAWNALLLDIPLERLTLLRKLKNKYRTFLLSNINEIHLNEVNRILFETSGIPSFDTLFEKVYYSYQLKLAKPGVEIYNFVINENNLNPLETIFIDDIIENLEGARLAGLKTLHVKPPVTILELLKDA